MVGGDNMEFITITMDEYNDLIEAMEFLQCLEACGVDNWNGYSDAVEMFECDEDDDCCDDY
jgi:hypothetical protein